VTISTKKIKQHNCLHWWWWWW